MRYDIDLLANPRLVGRLGRKDCVARLGKERSGVNGNQKIRRRRRLAVLVATPAVLLGAGASVLLVGGPASQAAAIRADLEDLLDSRSPGERQAGALATSKPARPQAATERVLSPVRYRRPVTPPGAAAPAGVAPVVVGAPEDAVAAVSASAPTAVDAPDLGGLGGPVAFAPGAIFAPSAGASPGGGASGGSTTPPTGVTAPPAADILSAVPEPATWVSLILGFLLMGLALRRSGRAASDGHPAASQKATE